jgi:hypothetical protein
VSEAVVLDAIDDALADGATVRDVATQVSSALGVPHRFVYELALQRRTAKP